MVVRARRSARLTLPFFRRPALDVAADLLGRTLCRRVAPGRVLRGRITEVEAYDGFDDRACHASRGRTERNAPMFARGGIAYVYLIYGMHHCLNVVTGQRGHPSAVLIRSTEPPAPGAVATGPGRLTRAFAVDRRLDGASLVGREIWLESGRPVSADSIRRTPRIGVDYAGESAGWPWRFVIEGHADLSGPRSMR